MEPLAISQLDMIKIEAVGMIADRAFPGYDFALVLMKDGAGAVITDNPKHLDTIAAAVKVAKASFEGDAEFPPLTVNDAGEVTNLLTGELAKAYTDAE